MTHSDMNTIVIMAKMIMAYRLALILLALLRFQGLLQIRNEVIGVLKTDRRAQ